MMNFTAEMIEKAKTAESVEQLLEIAKANAVEMTPAEAATYFAQLNPVTGELSDDDLDNVAGGGCSENQSPSYIPANGTRVRMLTKDRCRVCGGAEGYINFQPGYANIINVVCTTCANGTNCVACLQAHIEIQEGIDYELI